MSLVDPNLDFDTWYENNGHLNKLRKQDFYQPDKNVSGVLQYLNYGKPEGWHKECGNLKDKQDKLQLLDLVP